MFDFLLSLLLWFPLLENLLTKHPFQLTPSLTSGTPRCHELQGAIHMKLLWSGTVIRDKLIRVGDIYQKMTKEEVT